MKLTVQEVEHIANLARLSLSPEEKEQYAEQLSAIFDYVDLLQEVDTSGVEASEGVSQLTDIVREDTVIETEEEIRKKLIAAFPKRMGNLLKVPGVFES
ncbi:MAG: Asp-tRNA(Asn)/Glu-tRNA(Gln) amidotransferase subunit GatC [Candidatus Magasanikbacteria bacterium]|nr:Asp-tRNA(Asn)/Glu-tRNA(Gln) amidotransferase subunit GatC [Candidatus Magasanikbacteria bacterium]